MKKSFAVMSRVAPVLFGLVCAGVLPAQQPGQSATVLASMIVSVEAKHGKEIPKIYPDDVRVLHGRERLKVQSWTPCQSQATGVELFVLIDDSADTSLALQFNDLKKFIEDQPPTTLVALGYIRNGTVEVAQKFTEDHAVIEKGLRLPMGAGVVSSPYTAITELVKSWPESARCRQVMLISPGFDALQPGITNTYVDDAIETAQRAGVQIYSIYAAPSGHFGHTFWRITNAQSNLSRLTDETGGEAYFQNLEMPIAFAPYLNQYAERVQHQFKLTFLAIAANKPEMQSIKLQTEVPNAELVAASRVYVPGVR